MVDGYTWQGFKVDGNLNITKYQPGMGLRYIPGDDPGNSNDNFSLGQGSPQVWEPNVYAAGTAACEIRIVKSTTIQPSIPDQHQMTVPIDYGMWGALPGDHAETIQETICRVCRVSESRATVQGREKGRWWDNIGQNE